MMKSLHVKKDGIAWSATPLFGCGLMSASPSAEQVSFAVVLIARAVLLIVEFVSVLWNTSAPVASLDTSLTSEASA